MNSVFGTPGSVQFSFLTFFKYLGGLFSNNTSDNFYRKNDDEYIITGYSCRQLFQSFIENNRKDIKVGVSAIHHSSFVKIIESYFDKSNIYIFDYDDSYNKVIVPEDIDFDLIIVSHLWGKYLDLSELTKYKNGKCIIVEDNVLGGSHDKYTDFSDVQFYSCGFDKRPANIFGGYMKTKNEDIAENMISSIKKLEYPTFMEQLKKIFDVFVLCILYRLRIVQDLIKVMVNLLNIKLHTIVEKVRKNKPGFQHGKYMKRPTGLMVSQINDSMIHRCIQEYTIYNHNEIFTNCFDENIKNRFFFLNGSYLTYNIIYLEDHKTDFIDFFDKHNVCVIKNPTYKTFSHAPEKIHQFLDNIYYLPCLYHMDYCDIIELSVIVNKYILQS